VIREANASCWGRGRRNGGWRKKSADRGSPRLLSKEKGERISTRTIGITVKRRRKGNVIGM